MKRFCALCLTALALCSLLCACSQEEPSQTPPPSTSSEAPASPAPPAAPAPYAAGDAQALVDAGACDGAMEEVDSFIVSLLYGIDEATITECKSFLAINTSVSADEVTVLVLTDEETAAAAEAACRKRAEDQITACTNYCPDQVPRLEDAVILRRENTVLFAVGNPENLPKALEELGLN